MSEQKSKGWEWTSRENADFIEEYDLVRRVGSDRHTHIYLGRAGALLAALFAAITVHSLLS